MADIASHPKQNAARPQLTSTMRSSSYLSDNQEYRPPRQPEPHHGIDTVVEDIPASASPKPGLPFNGVPSEDNPPTIVESGVNHSFSHPNCAPLSGRRTDRLIATLFYKSAVGANGSRSPAKGGLSDSNESLPANLAPTTNIDAFPLEPPTQESEQLDHLYGSYISPLCITSLLHLMSTFPQPRDADLPHSSHRCLDNRESPRVVELTLAPAPCPKYLSLSDLRKHEIIYRFEREWNVDVALQRDLVWRRHPRLVVFDMDSTLITQEVIELMAETVKDPPDLPARVADITHRAMLGELEFEASFRERVALLKGVSGSLFDELRPVLEVTKGARELIKALKRLGVKTAVLSGGFQPLTSWLAQDLGIDYAYANEVVVVDGKLTGQATGTIVGRERKRDLLVEIAAKEKIDLAQVVAVGDGANDLLMLDKAGLGVAWNAKPRVQMEADARLNGESLLDLLFLFGFTSEEVDTLVE
ncbi:Phosphoserine phosphatase [Tolypocladium ophioglossoides CBS 100239]|uniref:phosphoserine phosphatase n=1 Tax=Tolypocladium ophioglossoides (strain CBS 100239) TaxID=1163406 RepID=A0A0L0N6Z4_TOLOC|nr:Phosphoserine phosphatase [Tolypocladium ophioglossoides CBS 100239]